MAVAISKLSYGLLDNLREFFDKQEAKLADTLLLSFTPSTPSLPLHGTGHIRLAQALERMSANRNSPISVEMINGALWEYVEVLESAAQELIERVRHYPLNGWSDEFYYIALGFNELIAHRIEDLIWVFRRIDSLLFSLKKYSFKKLFKGLFTILDRRVLNHLSRTEDALSIHAKNFDLCFAALRKDIEESRINEAKLLVFPVFPTLSFGIQETLLILCRFLKVLDENKKHFVFKNEEITKTIRGIAKIGTMTLHFREYLVQVRRFFFDLAKLWRQIQDTHLATTLLNVQGELNFLKALIGSYREILLAPHRFAFSRWLVGPEPKKTRDLLTLLYEIDTLNKLFTQLQGTLEKGPNPDQMIKHLEVQQKMEEVLHEMGQPLSSRQQLQTKAERFLEYWELADELGGSAGNVENLVTNWLIKALRYDSLAQSFPSMPRFFELLMVHRGCQEPIEDREHEKRMKLFSQIISHVEQWIKEHAVEKHSKDLEVDEASLHETFQNFLALIQRKVLPDKGGWEAYSQMLLDYRVLFARFFYALRLALGEGKQVRAHFFFVDHYLEAIEMQLKA